MSRTSIQLLPFTKQDFDTLKSWVDTPEALFQFAGPIFSFPLTDQQLTDYVGMEDKRPMKVVLSDTQETIGHCELNFENGQRRLSRILVGNKELRGQKIGEQMVRKMADLLFADPDTKEIDLNTFDWNKAAIRCYEKVGFVIDDEQTEPMIVGDQVWTKLNLVLTREDYEESRRDEHD